jgi:uncharacterized protein (DUF2461 family)
MSTEMDKARRRLKAAFVRRFNAQGKFQIGTLTRKGLKEEADRLDKAIRKFEHAARSELVDKALVARSYLINPYINAAKQKMPEVAQKDLELVTRLVCQIAGVSVLRRDV